MAKKYSHLLSYAVAFMILFATANERLKVAGISVYNFFMFLGFMLLLLGCVIVIPKQKFLRFPLLWLAFAVLLMLISREPTTTIQFLSVVNNALFMILIILAGRTKKAWLIMVSGYLIGHLCSLVLSFYEFATHQHFYLLTAYYERTMGKNALGFQVNVNDNGLVMIFALLMIAIFKYANYQYLRKRYLFALTLLEIATVGVIIRIGSRTAILALIAFAIWMVCYNYICKLQASSKHIILFVIAITCGVIVVVVALYGVINMLMLVYGAGIEATDTLRVELILQGLRVFSEHFFLPIGPGALTNLLHQSPHFLFEEILVDYGVVVFVSLVMQLIRIYSIGKTIMNRKLSAAITSFPIIFVIMSIASSSAIRIRYCWIGLALVEAICILEKSGVPKDE